MATTAPAPVAVRGATYDWLALGAGAWLLGGLYWDGWAHGYGLPDSFFTVWHAAFYSGFLASALVVLGPVVVRAGAGWRAAIPVGYGPSVVGIFVFAFGGAFDMLWHSVFGIEANLDALFSPSHLVLGLGMALIFSGPLRAAWARRESSVPAVVALAMLLSLFTFFTLFAGPYSNVLGANPRPSSAENVVARSLLGMYLFSALVVGLALVALRRRTLPVGAMTAVLGLNGVAMILMRGHAPLQVQLVFSAVAIGAGIVGDLLLWRLRPSLERVNALRAFAFALPVAYFTLYFIAVLTLTGTWWTVHLLTGSVVLAGVVGLLVSFVYGERAA